MVYLLARLDRTSLRIFFQDFQLGWFQTSLYLDSMIVFKKKPLWHV